MRCLVALLLTVSLGLSVIEVGAQGNDTHETCWFVTTNFSSRFFDPLQCVANSSNPTMLNCHIQSGQTTTFQISSNNELNSTRSKRSTTVFEDGTVEQVLPDGTIITTFPDGTVIRVQPNGIIITMYPDGSTVWEHPNGRKIITLPNGKMKVTPEKQTPPKIITDGTLEVTCTATGLTAIHEKNGTTVEVIEEIEELSVDRATEPTTAPSTAPTTAPSTVPTTTPSIVPITPPITTPRDCVWGMWHDWTPCTRTCGNAIRARIRFREIEAANGGRECIGVSQENQPCSGQPPCANRTYTRCWCLYHEWSYTMSVP